MSFLKRLSKSSKRKSKPQILQSPVQVALPAGKGLDEPLSPISATSNGRLSSSSGDYSASRTPPKVVKPEEAPFKVLKAEPPASHAPAADLEVFVPVETTLNEPAQPLERKEEPAVALDHSTVTATSSLTSHKFPLHALLSNAISSDQDPVLAPTSSVTSCLDLSLRESSFLEEVAERHSTATELVAVYHEAKTPSPFKLVKQDLRQPFPAGWANRFDLINATLTFSQMQASTWPALLEQILECLKPGGWLQVVDLAGVQTYQKHSRDNAMGQALIQAAMDSLWNEPDSGLSNIVQLGRYIQEARFGNIRTSVHHLKTGQLQQDPQLAQLSVETLTQSVLQAKKIGAFNDIYSFNGHAVYFPETEAEWQNVVPNIRNALMEGVQQHIITLVAQRPLA